jgi:pimeloyl-ACP methyl ester carboxylesterase
VAAQTLWLRSALTAPEAKADICLRQPELLLPLWLAASMAKVKSCWPDSMPACCPAVLTAGFPVLVIHGRNDKLASAANAEALARRLNAPCVIL